MPEPRLLRVFLCHAKEDKPVVRELYNFLKSQPWIDPWLDELKLLPGMDWDLEIYKALREADSILVCLSKESVAKEGYVQKEFKRALNFAEEKPEGVPFYIIPLRLDDCTPPLQFQKWQWVDYFLPESPKRILASLYKRATSLKILPPPPRPAPASPPPSPSVDAPIIIPEFPGPMKTTPGGHAIYVFGGIEFVKISKGPFIMGSKLANEYADENETPRHTVDIPYDYWIGRFPVTNEQFAEFIEATHYPFEWIDGWKKRLDHPVVNTSWKDTLSYLKWLNTTFGKELPKGFVFRLPTEAEWEKAARGTDGREWPWGNEFDKNKCNSKEGSPGGTTPVGAFSPRGDSPYGCADMVGNVWEWCHSLYKPYPYKADDGREDETASGSRCLRGGSFLSYRRGARCASRNDGDPGYRDGLIGFRVCVSPIS